MVEFLIGVGLLITIVALYGSWLLRGIVKQNTGHSAMTLSVVSLVLCLAAGWVGFLAAQSVVGIGIVSHVFLSMVATDACLLVIWITAAIVSTARR
jgi:hypothetical protein